MGLRTLINASSLFALSVTLAFAVGCGDSDDAGGGAGTGGAGGTGGSSGGDEISIVVPGCLTSAYQVVFRGFLEPMDPLLRYMDTPAEQRDASQKPPIVSLSELKTVPGVYSRFTWNADDVPGVSDPDGTLITADFIESSGLNPADLDDGISGSEVVLVPWEMTVDESTKVGAGKLSIRGLDEDTVRVTIVALDPEEGRPLNPWYEANSCLFEIKGFQLQLDLATPDSDPFAVIIDFTAEGDGYAIENGSIILGEGDSASFSGSYKLGSATAVPFNFELDYSSDPASIEGTFGDVPASCTIDLDTLEVTC